MQPSESSPPRSLFSRAPIWCWGLLVAGAAVTSSLPATRNMFTQDDQAAIADDIRIHSPSQWDRFLDEPYWSERYGGHLYRPALSLGLGAQWQVQNGAPLPFRIISLTIYAASSIAVLFLFCQFLPVGPALIGSLFFAVHPVHVEAVAIAVNQGELLVALLGTLVVAYYIRGRRSGALGARFRWGAFAAVLIGGLIRENAAIIPALVLIAEFTVLWDLPRGSRSRWHHVWPPQFLMVLAVIANVVLRYRVHAGKLSGTFTAEGLAGLTMGERALTMAAGVFPEWLRLLLWPATLSADYSPREIMPQTAFSVEVGLGVTIILLLLVLAGRSLTRAPALSFGILFAAIALGPVSNIIVPTGIVLAERTLFLPTVGAMAAVGALVSVALAATPTRSRVTNTLFAAIALAVCALGISRSQSRHAVWRNQLVLSTQTVIDAPDSYRSFFALGYLMRKLGYPERAEYMMERSVALYDQATGPVLTLADIYRRTDRCEQAIPLYERALSVEEFAPGRSSYIACLAHVGDYQKGRDEALTGIGSGYYTRVFLAWFRLLDSVRRDPPPAGTVRFPEDKAFLFTEALREPGVMERRPVDAPDVEPGP